MKKYNYYEALWKDLENAMPEYLNEIKENGKAECTEDVIEAMYDFAVIDDNITGNGSGSYFFSRWKAEEAICHNWDIIDDIIAEGYINLNNEDPESLDVHIRCYLLYGVLSEYVIKHHEEIFSLIKVKSAFDE